MTDDSPGTPFGGGTGRALLSAAVAVLLLIVITPLRWLLLPIAIVSVLAFIVYGFRGVLQFNRTLGVGSIAIVTTCVCVYLAFVYRAEIQHQALLKNLEEYGDVTVRRNLFPIPYVHQLSVGDGVSDTDLASILRLDGLDRISDLYLKNDILTDACLQDAAKIRDLQYIFIDCDKISDDAILQFVARFPDCTVIPYQRNLRDTPDIFLGTPPDD